MPAPAGPGRWRLVAGTSLVLGTALAAAAGGVWSAVVAIVGVIVTACAVRLMAPPHHRDLVSLLVFTAFGLRAAFAMVLDMYLLRSGHIYRNLFWDDAGYVLIAGQIADKWRGGIPVGGIDPSLDHYYVSLAAGLFYLIGNEPAALKLINTTFGVLSALLLYWTMLTLRLPGPRLALAAMLVFPSIVMWSALALKDAYSIFFAMLALLGVSAFVRSRNLRWHFVVAAALVLLANVRIYLFVFLVVLWPLALAVMPGGRRRWTGTAPAALLGSVMLLSFFPSPYVPGFQTFNFLRSAMALGARSSFVEPLPAFQGRSGQGFTVAVGTPSASRPTTAPTAVPYQVCVFMVPSGTQVDVSLETGPRPPCPAPIIVPAGTKVVVVRPGDQVYLDQPPPAGASPPGALALDPEVRNIVRTLAPTAAPSTDAVAVPPGLVENLLHLPVGAAFLLGAPFPFTWRSASEAATVIELLLWYPTVVLAAIGLWSAVRARRWDLAYPIGTAALIFGLFALVEGNVGTLVRHRSMLIPYAVLLAAVGASRLLRRDADELMPGVRATRSEEATAAY